jgi:phospholipid transport system substrate-binding protein
MLLACAVACAPRASVVPEVKPPVPDSAAVAVVLELQAVLLAVMKEADALGYDGRKQRLLAATREAYDIPFMARATLGAQWDELSPGEQADWVQLFERFHVSALADTYPRWMGQHFELVGEEPGASGTLRVRTRYVDPRRNVRIGQDYRLRRQQGRWRIIDSFSPSHVSELEMRSAEYKTIIDARGYAGLVESMQRRIDRRSDERPESAPTPPR